MRKISWGLFVLSTVVSAMVFAREKQTSFVTMPDGYKIYVEQYKAEPGYNTLVLLNGLTYTTKAWSKMVEPLINTPYGIVIYDCRGMGASLEANSEITDIIPLRQQTEDLKVLLDTLGLNQVVVAGLSYGGGLAIDFTSQYPDMIKSAVLLAPFVKPLAQQDQMIKSRVRTHRMMRPNDPRTDDELYDFYLKDVVYQQYPIYEPVIREHPWRVGAVYHMVRGIRKFPAIEVAGKIESTKFHMVVAERDEYVPRADHDELWAAIGAKQSFTRLMVKGTKHKLPEEAPIATAGWILEILKENPLLYGGKTFSQDTRTGVVTGPQGEKIQLPKGP